MSFYNDQQLFQAIQPHLQPGEQVRSIGYGTKHMPMWAQIICALIIFGTLLPGLIIYLIWHFATLEYFLLALTDRRILVVKVKGLAPITTWDYPLPFQGHVTSRHVGWGAGKAFEISLSAPRPFTARFLNKSGPTNMVNAQNIAQAIGQSRMGGPMGAPQMGPPQIGAPPGAPQLGPGGAPPGGGYGPPPGGGGGYGPPPGGGAPGGGYGPPPGGGGYGPPPGGGGYGPPPGGGYGPPPGGGAPGGGWGQG